MAAPGEQYTFDQLEYLAKQAGWGDESGLAAAIALGESTGYPNAHNDEYPDDSWGLMQINMIDSPDKGLLLGQERREKYGIGRNEELFDPLTNMKIAKKIRDEQGLNAWTVYKNGTYKNNFPTNYKASNTNDSGPVSSSDTSAADKPDSNEQDVRIKLKDLAAFVNALNNRSSNKSEPDAVNTQFDQMEDDYKKDKKVEDYKKSVDEVLENQRLLVKKIEDMEKGSKKNLQAENEKIMARAMQAFQQGRSVI